MPKTIIEPFRIRAVEPIPFTTRSERETLLEQAELNVFKLHADHVLLDFLTDSGTGAMSSRQWAGIMTGDESYAGARSFFHFESVVQRITGYKTVFPVHQGRAAERILFGTLLKAGDIIPSNTHFDTTRANIEFTGAEARDLVIAEGLEPRLIHPFKGNIDLNRVEDLLKKESQNIPFGMITITNNSGGGQPVSYENIKAYSQLLKKYNKPLIIDACRFAENAMFIKMREKGFENKTIEEIARMVFDLGDGCTMSAKKDGMVNIGGFLALREDTWTEKLRTFLVLTEGFPTYGGLAGRDLDAMAIGLDEALDEHYLRYRLRTAEYMGEKLKKGGVTLVEPTGGHAVYLDAKSFLPHLKQEDYPAWSLTCALYLSAGIRAVEIGSVMFGKLLPDGTETFHKMELVRLAFPRRVYTQSHFDYAAEAILELKEEAAKVRGVRIAHQPPFLRHFTSGFRWG